MPGTGRYQQVVAGKLFGPGMADKLFYVARDGSLLTVSVEKRGSDWGAGAPQKFLDNRYFSGGGVPRQYDVRIRRSTGS